MATIPIPNVQEQLLSDGISGNFSLYFPRMVTWLEKNDELSKDIACIVELCKKSDTRFNAAKTALDNIHKKQKRIIEKTLSPDNQFFELHATLVSPYVSGLGSGHPTETGMILDRNTGLPFIPASGIKGVMRLAHTLNIMDKEILEKNKNADYKSKWFRQGIITNGKFEEQKNGDQYCIDDTEPSLRKYFGDTTPGDGKVRGQLVFLDAFPTTDAIAKGLLKADIMTPHFSNYYKGPEEGKHLFRGPVETETPIPIKFLTVKEGVEFVFRCFVSPLGQPKEPDGVERSWSEDDSNAFKEMFKRGLEKLGLGAKTAIGYGRFKINEDFLAKQKRDADEERRVKRNAEDKANKEAEKERKKNEDAEKESLKQNLLQAMCKRVTEEIENLGISEVKKVQEKNEKQKRFLLFVQSILAGSPQIDKNIITSITDGILCNLSPRTANDFHKCAAKEILKIKSNEHDWLKANDRRKKLNSILRSE